jgi:hypothetical protein
MYVVIDEVTKVVMSTPQAKRIAELICESMNKGMGEFYTIQPV